jgi:hypothetical protein
MEKEKLVLRAIVIVGLVLALFFGFRTVKSAIRVARTGLEPGTVKTESLRGWMTIPYIAKAFEVPEEYLFAKLGLSGEGYRGRSLSSINRELAPDRKGFAVETIKAALSEYLKSRPQSGAKAETP